MYTSFSSDIVREGYLSKGKRFDKAENFSTDFISIRVYIIRFLPLILWLCVRELLGWCKGFLLIRYRPKKINKQTSTML